MWSLNVEFQYGNSRICNILLVYANAKISRNVLSSELLLENRSYFGLRKTKLDEKVTTPTNFSSRIHLEYS